MANPDHLNTLRQGVDAWNAWRKPDITPELAGADLREANLNGANLSGANLNGADLRDAHLHWADLSEADLSEAHLLSETNLNGANLSRAYLLSETNLSGADLREANLSKADLTGANLIKADLSGANLDEANLWGADLREAHLRGANLSRANLSGANLRGAKLSKADLAYATLVDADSTDANLTDCRIYGVSAWGLKLSGETSQRNLIITRTRNEPKITVDNIEVAQFIYLLLNNQKIRQVIDTITSKVVLILGRFTHERKAVLDALRDELRKRDYLPILFDFNKPDSKDLTGTVTTLANMVRFIVADGTDPKSIPHELATIVPTTIVPVKPILLASEREYAMFGDLQRRYHWVLPTHCYEHQEQLIADLDLCVIRPAAEKAEELRKTVST
jgi:uncharacterized protein YjbI with pentapeptide repeats